MLANIKTKSKSIKTVAYVPEMNYIPVKGYILFHNIRTTQITLHCYLITIP